MTDVSDFNLRMVSLYSSRAFLVAGRFYDLAPDRWDKLACLWYARHNFFELPGDRYLTDTMVRFKSVDALVAEIDPQMTPTAQHLYDQWMGIKKRLEESRKDKPIPIEPPKPTPTPLPIPAPIPEPKPDPKPEQPKNPSPGLVRFGVWFGIISSVVGVVAWFVPALKPWVAAIVPIIRAILSALGA
jgi:hypothetical protein